MLLSAEMPNLARAVQPPHHVVVVGAGALGSAIAVGLAKAGANITLLARGARRERLRHHPVELESDGHISTVHVATADWPELTRACDVAILCTKAGNLEEVARQIGLHLAPAATVITLQNGIAAPQLAAELLPGAAIVAGRVHGFFEMAGHRVRHVGVQPSVKLGGIAGTPEQVLPGASTLLQRAGFACQISDNIVHDLWEKLMLAASLGPVAVTLGVAAGQLSQVDGGLALLREAMSEVARVGAACGAMLDDSDVERMIEFVRQFPSDATTSLQRDILAGAPSEYDATVGAVIRSAQLRGIAAPVFAALDSQLRR